MHTSVKLTSVATGSVLGSDTMQSNPECFILFYNDHCMSLPVHTRHVFFSASCAAGDVSRHLKKLYGRIKEELDSPLPCLSTSGVK